MSDATAPGYFRGLRGGHDERTLTANWSARSKAKAASAPKQPSPPIPIKGRVLAKIADYQALWQAMRDRVSELQITMLELDGLSQACDGYSAKILGPSQFKSFGVKSLGRMLDGTGTYLVLVEDPDATADIKAFASKRQRPERSTAPARLAMAEDNPRHSSSVSRART